MFDQGWFEFLWQSLVRSELLERMVGWGVYPIHTELYVNAFREDEAEDQMKVLRYAG